MSAWPNSKRLSLSRRPWPDAYAFSVAAGILHLPVESAVTTALRRRSNPMPISVPNYRRNTDRFQFGILIAITSEY
jgi:hypothetical protein